MTKKASRISEMEQGIRDMSVFEEYPREKEGIAVYYPTYRDGSCAEPVYVKFFRSPKGTSMALASKHEYEMQERERIGFLLRRENVNQ